MITNMVYMSVYMTVHMSVHMSVYIGVYVGVYRCIMAVYESVVCFFENPSIRPDDPTVIIYQLI